MIISSIVSVLILWSGDFKARLQFDGPLRTEIRGEFLDNSSDRTCEVYAQFDEVMHKEKNQLEKFIKADFRFVCPVDEQAQTQDKTTTAKSATQQIKIATEMIRLADLKTHSSQVFISNKYKKNILKIENYSLDVIKKMPKGKMKSSL